MWNTILTLLLLIAVINWFKWNVTAKTMCYWVTAKGHTLPTDEELKACSTHVVKKMLRQ